MSNIRSIPIFAQAREGEKALEALSGICVNTLTNVSERCYDRDKHKDGEPCYHEKDDVACSKCVDCNPARLYKSDTFWYTSNSFKRRYKQEEAKVGDTFYDGNNGDKHEVVAVDLESSRLAYRNCDQCEEVLNIAIW